MGPRPYDLLPAYLKGVDVGLLPNRLNEYTASMFPMKFFEYLSAGLPVAAVDLPAVREFGHVVETGTGVEGFIAAIERALASGEAGRMERLEVASAYTYAARTERMMEILGDQESGDRESDRRGGTLRAETSEHHCPVPVRGARTLPA